MEQRAVTVSEIKDFQTCPTMWAFKHYARRVRSGTGGGLGLARGTVLHRVLEGFDPATGTPEWFEAEGLRVLSEVWEGEPPEDLVKQTLDLLWFAGEWARDPSTTWGTVEREVAAEIPGFVKGTPDVVLRTQHGLLHRQYKTLGIGDPISRARAQELSLHEGLYARLIQDRFPGERYLGTELVTFRVTSRYARAAGEVDDQGRKGYRLKGWNEAVSISRLPVVGGLESRALQSIAYWRGEVLAAERTLQTWDKQDAPRLPFTDNCFLWGRLCEYAGVCGGTDRLQDEVLFKDADPEARYHAAANAASDGEEFSA